MHPYTRQILNFYQSHSNPEQAPAMEKYMRNRFRFFGIKRPERYLIDKKLIEELGTPQPEEFLQIIKELFDQNYREPHYLIAELFYKQRKKWDKSAVNQIEYMITHKSWWDTVDFLASKHAGYYFKKYPDEISGVTNRWNQDKNFWLQRSSLLFQLGYKAETNTQLIKKYILNLSASEEFFIRKAIGWILREYSKTNPDWVLQFTDEHPLSPLSKREALKHLKKKSK